MGKKGKPSARLNPRKLTNNRLLLIAILATLIVAALAIIMRMDSPSIWAFLCLVITALLGQPND